MNDLITNNFTEEVNMHLLEKNFRLQKILLVITSVYAVLGGIRNIKFFLKFFESPDEKAALWYGTIFPMIDFCLLVLVILSFYYYYKAHKILLESIEKKDAFLFNRGYTAFYKSGLISMIGYLLTIAGVSITFFY